MSNINNKKDLNIHSKPSVTPLKSPSPDIQSTNYILSTSSPQFKNFKASKEVDVTSRLYKHL